MIRRAMIAGKIDDLYALSFEIRLFSSENLLSEKQKKRDIKPMIRANKATLSILEEFTSSAVIAGIVRIWMPRTLDNAVAVYDETMQGISASSLVKEGDANCIPKRTPEIGDPNRAPNAAEAPAMR